jgi:hypothetical protein
VAVPIIVFPTVWQLVASINMASSDHIDDMTHIDAPINDPTDKNRG